MRLNKDLICKWCRRSGTAVVLMSTALLSTILTESTLARPRAQAVLTEGVILLQITDTQPFQRVTPFIGIYRNNRIQAIQGQTATVLCDNVLIPIPDRGLLTIEEVCLRGANTIERDGQDVPRGGSDLAIPFLITPRSTKILTARPAIRWNPVATATTYTVTLLGPEGKLWSKTVDEAGMPYPSDEPPLEAGIQYVFEVTTDRGVSSADEGIAGLAFSLMDQARQQEVEAALAELGELTLPAEAVAYATAHVYRQNGLLADAINVLETLDSEVTQPTASYLLLGDLYLQTQLNQKAKDAYLKALEVAEDSANLEEYASALTALGGVYLVLNDIQESRRYLAAALNLYIALGASDHSTAQAIKSQLDELEP